MTTAPFAEVLNSAKTMIAGLQANLETVAKRGLDKEFTAKMERTLDVIKNLDNEQEALKAKLKTKTAEMDSELNNLKALLSEAKKVVKMSVDQAGWREFGIEDKR